MIWITLCHIFQDVEEPSYHVSHRFNRTHCAEALFCRVPLLLNCHTIILQQCEWSCRSLPTLSLWLQASVYRGQRGKKNQKNCNRIRKLEGYLQDYQVHPLCQCRLFIAITYSIGSYWSPMMDRYIYNFTKILYTVVSFVRRNCFTKI